MTVTHPVDRGTCHHCKADIIRFPDIDPPHWLHDPKPGFRGRRCRGRDTMAEPDGPIFYDTFESKF